MCLITMIVTPYADDEDYAGCTFRLWDYGCLLGIILYCAVDDENVDDEQYQRDGYRWP